MKYPALDFSTMLCANFSASEGVGGDKSKLLEAMKKYREDFDATKDLLHSAQIKLESASVAALTKRMELEDLQEQAATIESSLKKLKKDSSPLKLLKSGSKHDEETTPGRVDNVITAIRQVQEKRRSVVNE